MLVLLLFFTLISFSFSIPLPIQDKPYYEDLSTRFLLMGQKPVAEWSYLPFDNITQIIADQSINSLSWVLTPKSLYQFYQNGTSVRYDTILSISITPDMQLASNPNNLGGGFVLSDLTHLYIFYNPNVFQSFILSPLLGARLVSLVSDNAGSVYLATDLNVYNFTIRTTSLVIIDAIVDSPLVLHWSAGCGLAVGTVGRLFRPIAFMYPGSVVNTGWRYEWLGNYDSPITALACDRDSNLWIGNNESITLQYRNGTFGRIGGLQGLPYGNVTSIARGFDNEMIIGTTAAFYISRDLVVGNWSWYMGPRWLPYGAILGLSVGTNAKNYRVLYVATEFGIAVIERQLWTLEQKALYFENIVDLRHNRWGLVAASDLQSFGNLSSSTTVTSDNDGLWTSIFVTAEAYRYAVTKDSNVQSRAWTHFQAIKMLQDVTPIVGLPARSYVKQGEYYGSGTWYNSTTMPGWIWKADTSSDEIVGHMMVYPIVYDLLAVTSDQRKDAYNCAINLMSYIVDNDLYLIDVTGKPTTWGKWNPIYLNDDPEWFDQRGLNSLQILSWLAASYRMSSNKTFLDVANTLITKNGYGINIVNQKIELPSDDNFSDDELAWLPYLTYYYNMGLSILNNASMEYQLSIDRSWKINNVEKPALWNLIYGVTRGTGIDSEVCHMKDTIWNLQNYPLELVNWPYDNRIRLDLFVNPDLTRFDTAQGVWSQILPAKETGFNRWNDNPYVMSGGSGMSEADPAGYLLPYWLGRYYGLISAPTA